MLSEGSFRSVGECCVWRLEDDVSPVEGAAAGGLSCADGSGDLWRAPSDCASHPGGRA